jgi:hypothetical protein
MKILHTTALALLVSAPLIEPAFAYRTNAPTRDFAHKLPQDDLIVMESKGKTGTDKYWFLSTLADEFSIGLIDYSVDVRRTPPNIAGMKQQIVPLQSLDKLHDLKVGQNGQIYDMRLMFNADFLWIEVWPSGSKTAPVRSAYMLSGSSEKTYAYYMNNPSSAVRYASQAEVVADIQKNYADKYNPDFINLIQYPPKGRDAILSTMNSEH